MRSDRTDAVMCTLEWHAQSVHFDLRNMPANLEDALEWSSFWRELRRLVDARDYAAAERHLAAAVTFVFSSKALDRRDQRLFQTPLHIEGSVLELGGSVKIADSLELRSGILTANISLTMELPMVGQAAASTWRKVVDEDPAYVAGIGLLVGPAREAPDVTDAVFLARILV